jgi:kojibiose phosphorylase
MTLPADRKNARSQAATPASDAPSSAAPAADPAHTATAAAQAAAAPSRPKRVPRTGASLPDRPFAVVCFDWDGTAVADRDDDARNVRSRVERLVALGVDVVAVSGTNVRNVDGQLRARPGGEGHLFMFLSRGSEVYVIGPRGPRLLERRQATAAEDAQLTAAAEALRDELVRRGLDVDIIYDRLNRRQVDLIPEWADPSKAEIGQLQKRVEERLQRAGFDGVGAVIDLAATFAQQAGLAHPAITSDVKHIDIGLTDKADSMRYLLRYLIRDRGRTPADLLVLGDEFGPIGDSEGSDYRTLIPELNEAVFASVGVEPNGTPPQVLNLGGGPAEFLRILDQQIDLRERVARDAFPEPGADRAWLFSSEGFDPFREREVETWFTVANGETGTRGSVEEGSAVSTPATFVAGVFGDGTGEPHFRQPVPAPDWLNLRLLVDGTQLTLANGEILEHRRVLDMRQGVVYRYWRQRDRFGRTVRVRTARFASLADRAIMAVRAEATLEDRSAMLVWEGCVGVSYAGGPTLATTFESRHTTGSIARTHGRNGGGHVLALTTNPAPGSPVARRIEQSRDVIGGHVVPGEPATIDRLAAIVSARTRPPSTDRAERALAQAESIGYDELLRRHLVAWDERWQDADVIIEGDDEAQLAVRFSIYHMISTGHPSKETVSVGARGLGGMSYFLHVFWDTEIFVLPFFIYSHPQTARTLLTYRYRNLDGARQKARDLGHAGALFPWESADRGVETTPPYGFGPDGEMIPILSGLMEHHISADVAWGVWEYWKATGDDEFMVSMGVEILLETARFWASRSARDEKDGRFHIRVVVGPDEYHEGVDDNAYTNVLARWNIDKGIAALAWLQEHDPAAAAILRERLELTRHEVEAWRFVAEHLADGYDPGTKLYEQFAGFYNMDDVDPDLLRPRPQAADLLLGREVTLVSKVVKQADVVMLCYILPDEIGDDVARANYDYYEPITVHGSSLSPGIHAALAARLGEIDLAVEAFKMACAIDLADNMGNAARGLHMATMGGIWQAAVMGFGGVRRRDETLVIDPHLPPEWQKLRLPLRFRGARLQLDIAHDRLGIVVTEASVHVVLDGREHTLRPGDHRFARVAGGVWRREKK